MDVDDDRLPPKAVVFGLTVGGEAVAYPQTALEGVLQDRVGGVPVLLVRSRADGGVRAFDRRMDGRRLTFERPGDSLVSADVSCWRANGTAVAGPLRSRRLDRLDLASLFWFAWVGTHPGTAVRRSSA